MTWPLALLLTIGTVVAVVALAGAAWGVGYAVVSLRAVHAQAVRNGRLIAARAILARSIGLALSLTAVTLVGLVRLLSELPVTGTTYAMFVPLVLVQLLLAAVTVIDTYERVALRHHYQARAEAPTRSRTSAEQAAEQQWSYPEGGPSW